MKKDLNEIAKIEKAIMEKYGEEAIQNPKKFWNKEKEEKYLKDLKKFYEVASEDSTPQEKKNGFFLRDRIKKKRDLRMCPTCDHYSLSTRDDLYMNKFECCEKCYVQYIEDREERWNSGWRPNK